MPNNKKMTIVRAGQLPLFTGVAIEQPEHTAHGSVNVDGGHVVIDGDETHLIKIQHDKGDGQDILRAVDNSTDTAT